METLSSQCKDLANLALQVCDAYADNKITDDQFKELCQVVWNVRVYVKDANSVIRKTLDA